MSKNKLKIRSLILLTLILVINGGAGILAQTAYKQTGTTVVMVSGTSTLHNWEMTSREASYQATFKINPEGVPIQLETLKLTVPAESLKSGKGSMDKNAYNSLETDKFKNITFTLVSSKMEEGIIKCSGNLTIASVMKQIDVEAGCKIQADKSLQCKGSRTLKMTEYKVTPPSFMLGTIKTGDQITISFEVNLSPVNPNSISK